MYEWMYVVYIDVIYGYTCVHVVGDLDNYPLSFVEPPKLKSIYISWNFEYF